MTEREEIEEQIRKELVTPSTAVALSNRLFGPGGLFGRLASTEEERRTLTQSPLFKQAQRSLSELQETEAAEFVQTTEQAQAAGSRGQQRPHFERAQSG